jgi:hypothetical protein
VLRTNTILLNALFCLQRGIAVWVDSSHAPDSQPPSFNGAAAVPLPSACRRPRVELELAGCRRLEVEQQLAGRCRAASLRAPQPRAELELVGRLHVASLRALPPMSRAGACRPPPSARRRPRAEQEPAGRCRAASLCALPPPSRASTRRHVASLCAPPPMSRAGARLPGLLARHAAVKISSCQTLSFFKVDYVGSGFSRNQDFHGSVLKESRPKQGPSIISGR